MENFTPYSALAGGAMIGLAAGLFFLLNGRIAGISGILGNLLTPASGDVLWRVAFVVGLIAGPLVALAIDPSLPLPTVPTSWPVIIAGGLLVGFGTRMGGGCTSGHGVCGIARLSPRSIVATVAFMAAGAATVAVMRHLLGA